MHEQRKHRGLDGERGTKRRRISRDQDSDPIAEEVEPIDDEVPLDKAALRRILNSLTSRLVEMQSDINRLTELVLNE